MIEDIERGIDAAHRCIDGLLTGGDVQALLTNLDYIVNLLSDIKQDYIRNAVQESGQDWEEARDLEDDG